MYALRTYFLKYYIRYLSTPYRNYTITHFRGTDKATHNILTFHISEISSNNSEKLNLLANKHLWAFLSHSVLCKFPDVESRALRGTLTPAFTPEKN